MNSEWLPRQLAQVASNAFRFDEAFRFVHLQFAQANASALVGERAGHAIRIRATGVVSVRFHTHPWAATVRLTIGERSWIEDLESADPDFRDVFIDFGAGAAPELKIEIVEGVSGRELWLVSLRFASRQHWMPHSLPLSEDLTMAFGSHGKFLVLRNDIYIGSEIVETGIWAPNDCEVFERLLLPGMTTIDVGANIGHHTTLMSKLVGPTGRVVAIEPQRLIFELLEANLLLNGVRNADAIRACVGDSAGFVHLDPVDYGERSNFGGIGVLPPDDHDATSIATLGERCRIDRLDSLLAVLNPSLTRCDFIKFDVQSYEYFALLGASEIITQFRPTMMVEIAPHWMSRMYDYREIYRFLWRHGYAIEHIGGPEIEDGSMRECGQEAFAEWDILARPRERV